MTENTEAPDPGDLPAGIGRPATRALTDAGLTSLALVVQRPQSEIAALHGVGPKAVRLLEEAVVAHGLIWGESG
ncbi:helix-hairpin-helix domain-containing protein [Aeromicrobium sp.]|uniref:helix-hairpin-helix domain-containing protein n=1 Tax=Aeromicrobium sp. TaxID=1871063 RepID=UPI0028B1D89F|nr:helix-hairpin-helix domain-containing protein [Aeromicrobium sp.]